MGGGPLPSRLFHTAWVWPGVSAKACSRDDEPRQTPTQRSLLFSMGEGGLVAPTSCTAAPFAKPPQCSVAADLSNAMECCISDQASPRCVFCQNHFVCLMYWQKNFASCISAKKVVYQCLFAKKLHHCVTQMHNLERSVSDHTTFFFRDR